MPGNSAFARKSRPSSSRRSRCLIRGDRCSPECSVQTVTDVTIRTDLPLVVVPVVLSHLACQFAVTEELSAAFNALIGSRELKVVQPWLKGFWKIIADGFGDNAFGTGEVLTQLETGRLKKTPRIDSDHRPLAARGVERRPGGFIRKLFGAVTARQSRRNDASVKRGAEILLEPASQI